MEPHKSFDLNNFYRDYDLFALEPTVEAADFVYLPTNIAGCEIDAVQSTLTDGIPPVAAADAGPSDLADGVPPVTAAVAAPPFSDKGTRVPHSAKTLVDEVGGYKLEKKRKKNRDKKRKRCLRQEDEAQDRRRLVFLNRSKPQETVGFGLHESRRAESGYIGVVYQGLDFAFLSGTSSRRLACLLLQGYEIVEFPRTK
ncbi:hypothetical protein FRC04_006636 [Tulasnella sp. 424]|nr:hypothetical protein FRC04_006636 [Tulasnella sp. 424]KAG8960752.1 hypothetical protein FRC05_006578 [Tulasnella sp. 425]